MVEPWLRDALATGPSPESLEIRFQPIVDLDDGRTVAAESFLHWEVPAGGRVPPTQWIPAAIANGWMSRVLRELAPAWSAFSEHPAGPVVSLNVSAAQLADDEFLHGLVGAASGASSALAVELHHLDLDPARGRREQPEWPWIHVPDLVPRLAHLRADGWEVWLDDWDGDAARLPLLLDSGAVDVVKADKARREDAVWLSDVARLAKEHGARTVVEGVERDDHRRIAVAAGVERGQGFLFAPPLDAAGLRAHLDDEPGHPTRTRRG